MVRTGILISLTAVLLGVSQPVSPQAVEQTQFCAEDESVSKPTVLPPAVRQILVADRDVSNELKHNGLQVTQLPDTWFSTSVVHLNGSSEIDLLVEAEGLLRGANVNSFWIFRPTSTGFAQILNAPAHDLIIKRSRSRGYRDIKIMAVIAMRVMTVEYRFDGIQYQPRSRTNESIR
jgi:hypothetical protein